MPGPPDQLSNGPAVVARAPCQTPVTVVYRAAHRMLPGRLHQRLTHSSWTQKVATTDIAQRAMADAASVWTGDGTQTDYMLRDQCITVDADDNITGSCSKLEAHQFNEQQPKGRLHRAFSVFLFNSEQKLLLQQRAASKITFPLVWTNTCCSHQLTGFDPDEVDDREGVINLRVMGSKHAAVRKLQHELGIPPSQVPVDTFKWWTRLHYCAADSSPEGKPTGWGEHEMDYILGLQADVDVKPNPEEVKEYRYVSWPELQEMMKPDSGMRWSPWFRELAGQHLQSWWEKLDTMVSADKHEGQLRIHRVAT